MLLNASFEGGWQDLPAVEETGWLTNQRPNNWDIEIIPVGGNLFGSTDKASGIPECVHKEVGQLPPVQQPGGADALILHGEHVYKVFHRGASFGVELRQTVTGLKPGTSGNLIVPIRIHGHESGADHYAAESGVWAAGVGRWVPIGESGNFAWHNHVVGFTVPDNGAVMVVIRFKSKWKQPVDFFIDDLRFTAVAAGQPEPPPPDPEPEPPPPPGVPYVVTVNLLPQDATQAEKAQVLAAVHSSRQTILQSADDAARLVAPGKSGSRVRVWGHHRWDADIVKWLQQHGVTDIEIVPFDSSPLAGLKFEQPLSTPWQFSNGGHFNAPRNYSEFGGKVNDRHEGLDVAPTASGTSHVLAMYPGRVVKIGVSAGYGNYVITEHTYNGRKFTLWRAHLQSVAVGAGQFVTARTWLGICGSTGNSSGRHDHCTMQAAGIGLSGYIVPDVIDPTPFYPQPGSPSGYTGPAVTFTPAIHGPGSDWMYPQPGMQALLDRLAMPVKFMTGGIAANYFQRFTKPEFHLVRVFWQPDRMKTAVEAWDDVKDGVAAFYQRGARKFELFNEPNLSHEGMGTVWAHGDEFGRWLAQFIGIMRQAFPQARLYYPGLSPGIPWTAQFGFTNAAWPHVRGLVQGFCMHAYTGVVDNQAKAVSEIVEQVTQTQKYIALDRPLVVSECSVNRAAPPNYKAAVYREVEQALAKIPGIEAICYFISHWDAPPAQQAHGESWLETGIANFYK